jgi:hypothetical protein
MWQSIVINFTHQGFPEHLLHGTVKYYVLREQIVLKSEFRFSFTYSWVCTYSMEQSSSCEANRPSTSQVIPRIL